MTTKACAQVKLATDNTPIPCDEFIATECVIYPNAMVELSIPENSNVEEILNAFLQAIININNQIGVSTEVVSGYVQGTDFIIEKANGTSVLIDVSSLIVEQRSRIVTGSVVGTNLILTRDDSTTITIDLSSIGFDQNNKIKVVDLGNINLLPADTQEEAVENAIVDKLNNLVPALVVEEDEIIILKASISGTGGPV